MNDPDQLSIELAMASCRANIGSTLGRVPTDDSDMPHADELIDVLQMRLSAAPPTGSDTRERTAPPGAWAVLMRLTLSNWPRSWRAATLLPAMRAAAKPEASPRSKEEELLDACANVLCVMARAARSGVDQEDRVELAGDIVRLAKATQNLGHSDLAYNLASDACIACRDCAVAEHACAFALERALEAGKAHQIAICSAHHAAEVAAAAMHAPERRAEAFKACELAVHRIEVAEEPFRSAAAERLETALDSGDYLAPMLYRVKSLMPPEGLSPAWKRFLGSTREPPRISKRPALAWFEELKTSLQASAAWNALETAKFSLEPSDEACVPTDWTAWTIDHPAYRHAVPHNRSFTRELDFDRHQLILTHELTHVFSLLGHIGTALTCLRVATFDDEVTLWSPMLHNIDWGIGSQRLANEGVAPLEDNNFALLIRTERALELTLKAQALQDIWLPWLEGLAVYGELCADPIEDTKAIDPVNMALLNMLDEHFHFDTSTKRDPQASVRDQLKRIDAFQKQCSDAIARLGPMRLRRYFREKTVPYMAGYVAVRAVVATWRRTANRRLSGAEVFRLALSATRFSTAVAIPDLSLNSDTFAKVAQELMCEWIRKLGELSKVEIDTFLAQPAADGRVKHVVWRNVRPAMVPDDEHADARQSKLTKQRLRQAFASLTRPEDAARVKPYRASRWGIGQGTQIIRKYLNSPSFEQRFPQYCKIVAGHMALRSLLPIGRTSARFFLNLGPNRSHSHLAALVRTTEAHIEDGEPSINLLSVFLSPESGDRLAQAVQRGADPRIDVTRIIDLTGVVTGILGLSGWHFLAYRYDDWFELRGSNDVATTALSHAIAENAYIPDMFKRRLYPEPVTRAEAEIIARGARGASRTRDWIDRSLQWQCAGVALNMDDWAAHVRSLADRVITETDRTEQQRQAAKHVIASIFCNETLAENIVDKGFLELTDEASERREAILDALVCTAGSRECDEVAIASAAATLVDCGLDILTQTADGWDVRPMA